MRTSLRTRTTAAIAVLAFSASGCSGGLENLGALGDILGGGGAGGAQQGQLTAEIQQVDQQQQMIHVRAEDGQTGSVRYDQNTQVVYQQQQYPVTALERGDIVVMQLQQDAQGNLYVGRVDVQQSVQERTGQSSGGTGQLQQVSGQVRQIDHTRGTFQVQTQNGSLVTVTLPYNPPEATLQYFHRLRAGDRVSLEGNVTGNARVELYRFL